MRYITEYDDIVVIWPDSPMCYNWKQVFAYYPVKTIQGKWIWWKPVFKRKVRFMFKTGNPTEDLVQYGTVLDVLSNKFMKFEQSKVLNATTLLANLRRQVG